MATTEEKSDAKADAIPISYAISLRRNSAKQRRLHAHARHYTMRLPTNEQLSEVIRRFRDANGQSAGRQVDLESKQPDQEPPLADSDRYIDARLDSIEEKLQTNLERTRERQDADAAWTKDMIARMERQAEQAETRFEKAGERFELAEQRFDAKVGEVLQEMRETRRHASVMSLTTVGAVIGALAIAATFIVGQMSDQGAWLRDSVNRIEAKVERQAPASAPPAAEATATEAPAD